MGLVQSNRNKNRNFDIVKSFSSAELETPTNTVTYTSSLRVSNHVKNKVRAISTLGLYGKTLSHVTEMLADEFINNMDEVSRQKVLFQIAVLEERDAALKQSERK